VTASTDDLVVTFDYRDAHRVATRRVVSPIRFLGKDRFLALCLSREEPRQFYLERCRNVRPAPAVNFLMPVELACWTWGAGGMAVSHRICHFNARRGSPHRSSC